MQDEKSLKEIIQAEYGQAARQATRGKTSCCGSGSILRTASWIRLPKICMRQRRPTASPRSPCGFLWMRKPDGISHDSIGETVLDLGSGGGIDVFLSARRVGPTGKVYGLDMTDDMLALARENQRKAGVTNVEFLKGEIEDIPLPDNSVDLIISNCVINLA